MSSHYVAVIEKDPDSAFGVWFPDVGGCFSAGDSLGKAVTNSAAALRQHAEALESTRRRLPVARTTNEVSCDSDVRKSIRSGAVLFAVSLLADAGRTVRLNISLDKALVDQIDAGAETRGLTRLAFLAQAARDKIAG